ncbi:class I SAM-dependent methyltransferase [Xanthocytophaga flava]|uniref:class I SAM-dependent methyltransferase n=1 Tax=Xanthocytophaga flava TaxID=3048013 RepID=UPI0028D500D0|nr:methyltransferase domain-containing protein [Xanthocytophaga flavus]MDJ1471712.1 methyltransferase domain-containing protein [Xanthocytophaga flavus]
MELSEAIDLIHTTAIRQTEPQIWADLGCGTGLFTKALTHLLPPQSTIYAIDKDAMALDTIPDNYQNILVKKLVKDFTQSFFLPSLLDGILMANSLHYVGDHLSFLHTIQSSLLQPSHKLLLVEYDTDKANPWVPYPVSFQSLQKLATKAGYTTIEKLGTKASLYGRANLYGALITK